MDLYPAIDLRGGKVVQLVQGDFDRALSAWQRALELKPRALAYSNVAVVIPPGSGGSTGLAESSRSDRTSLRMPSIC